MYVTLSCMLCSVCFNCHMSAVTYASGLWLILVHAVQMPYQVNGMEQPAAAIAAAAAAGGPGAGLGGDLLGAAAAVTTATNPLAAFFADPSGLLVLDVGGKTFRTTLNTLLAVNGSLFEQVAQGQAPQGGMQRLPSGEVFIDRSGEHFSYILEYLRACASNDITFPLPNDARWAWQSS